MLIYVVKLNGIYDILSSLCMLSYLNIPYMSYAHTEMLYCKYPILYRYYAYWIITYGCMRLINDVNIIRISYIIEAICTANELFYKKAIHPIKAIYVISVCCIISVLV